MKDPQKEWLLDQMEKKDTIEFHSHYDEFIERAKTTEPESWIPTDEEIEFWAICESKSLEERYGMIRGAKWMKRTLTKNK